MESKFKNAIVYDDVTETSHFMALSNELYKFFRDNPNARVISWPRPLSKLELSNVFCKESMEEFDF